MKKLKTIGILLFLSMTMCVMSQNPTARSMNRSIKAITRFQQMMGMKDMPEIIDQNPVTDIDRNEYKTVKVGNQIWMAENLKTKHYRNGDLIPNTNDSYRNGDSISNTNDSTTWVTLSKGAYCDVYNNVGNGEKGARLYNYYAITDKRSIAPKGWHVATINDWKTLTHTLAGVVLEEQGVTEILDREDKLNFSWMIGLRQNGSFLGVKEMGVFWSSTEYDGEKAWAWDVVYKSSMKIMSLTDKCPKSFGAAARCVKDAPIVKKTTKTAKKK